MNNLIIIKQHHPPQPLPTASPELVCKNCGNQFTMQYCNACGQKVAHRLDFHHILHEAVHVFTHADKGIFSLIPAVLFRPGIVAHDYVEGKRKRYFSIFQYLILIVGFTTFLVAKTGMMEAMADTFRDAQQSVRVKAVQAKVMGFMREYLNLVMFALIPVYAFFSWRLFKKKGYNYAENFVLHVAIQAQINTFSLLIVMPLAYFFAKQATVALAIAGFVILFISFSMANRQFFKVSWLQAIVKGVIIYLLTYLVQIILIAIIIFIIVATKSY